MSFRESVDQLFMWLRMAWCYEHPYYAECSQWTPGREWNHGCEHFEVEMTLLIPFWVKGEEAIEAYREKYSHENWLYLDKGE